MTASVPCQRCTHLTMSLYIRFPRKGIMVRSKDCGITRVNVMRLVQSSANSIGTMTATHFILNKVTVLQCFIVHEIEIILRNLLRHHKIHIRIHTVCQWPHICQAIAKTRLIWRWVNFTKCPFLRLTLTTKLEPLGAATTCAIQQPLLHRQPRGNPAVGPFRPFTDEYS
jgi:hypothetical protein